MVQMHVYRPNIRSNNDLDMFQDAPSTSPDVISFFSFSHMFNKYSWTPPPGGGMYGTKTRITS